jgi:pyruvate-ferredoxin/flavodoxin oxidoreductase
MKAFQEASAYDGPSVIIAYATCIAQGIELKNTVTQMRAAVDSAYWPLYRYNPELKRVGRNPMQLDSGPAKIPFEQYAMHENRYKQLKKMNPENATALVAQAKEDIEEKWNLFSELAKGI